MVLSIDGRQLTTGARFAEVLRARHCTQVPEDASLRAGKSYMSGAPLPLTTRFRLDGAPKRPASMKFLWSRWSQKQRTLGLSEEHLKILASMSALPGSTWSGRRGRALTSSTSMNSKGDTL